MKTILKYFIIIFFSIISISCSKDEPTSVNNSGEPTINILNINEGQIIVDSITIFIDAKDSKGIAKVELFLNDSLLMSKFTGPFHYYWQTTEIDSMKYIIYAKAYDADGNTVTTPVYNIIVLSTSKPELQYYEASDDSIYIEWNYTGRRDSFVIIYNIKDTLNQEININKYSAKNNIVYKDSILDLNVYNVRIIPIYRNTVGLNYENINLEFLYTPKLENLILPDTVYKQNNSNVNVEINVFNGDGFDKISEVYYLVYTPYRIEPFKLSLSINNQLSSIKAIYSTIIQASAFSIVGEYHFEFYARNINGRLSKVLRKIVICI